MNKRKKMAILKHRHKRKRSEERRKALLVASGGAAKPVFKAAPKKEKELPKPVKALADILKQKEAKPVHKAVKEKAAPAKSRR
jgi:hypothetical protein